MKKIIFGLLGLIATFTTCINNDIPFPYIKGEIINIEVVGQEGDVELDLVNNVATINISDTVDIRKIQFKKLDVTDGAIVWDSAGVPIDSTSIVNMSVADSTVSMAQDSLMWFVTTYQEYLWKIIPNQVINRRILVDGQIGDATIDPLNRIAVVRMPKESTDLENVKVLEFQLVNSIATYEPRPKTVTDFLLPVKFTVKYFDIEEEWTVEIITVDINVITQPADAWTSFAFLNAQVTSNDPSIKGFEYRVIPDNDGAVGEWTRLEVEAQGGNINGKIDGLDPGTEYEYRGFIGEERGETITFTTARKETVPNLNFDDGYMGIDNPKPNQSFYPNKANGNSYWATGNDGLTHFFAGNKPSNTIHTDDAFKGKAMVMESLGGITIALHAAGNLFTGDFKFKTVLDTAKMKKLVKFGRPYTGRPTSLKGQYKYTSTPITILQGNIEGVSLNDPDACHIYIILENWGTEGLAPTERPASVTRLGYGEFIDAKTINAYKEFSIPITYTNTELLPTHITIVATSSRYGEDFCGGVGSTLWVDEFELGWDYHDKLIE